MYQVKKRLLIICSIIGVLLAGFQFPIYAETTPPDYSSSTSIMASTPLDQYFYDNYNLLPYIESNGYQYINTNINASSSIVVNLSISDLNKLEDFNSVFISGSRTPYFDIGYNWNSDSLRLFFTDVSTGRSVYFPLNNYNIYNIQFGHGSVSLNNSVLYEYNTEEFTSAYPLYIFSTNIKGSPDDKYSIVKLYKYSIYDYAANEGEGALVRDYYPARSKSGGVIGLYDAVSKTFVTTSGSVPFDSPTGDPVNLSLGANITQFLSGSLSWIGAIFEGINEMPIIWVFIAIALAGVAFRWARRIVHF